ncbi:hypothetical protein D3C71_2060280 [compost metagenome]
MPVAVFGQGLRQALQLFGADPLTAPGDLFRAGDFQALTPLQRGDELAGLQQAVVGARVQPGVATAHDLDAELALLQIQAIEIGDLQLTPW